jgi:hypothetical protein
MLAIGIHFRQTFPFEQGKFKIPLEAWEFPPANDFFSTAVVFVSIGNSLDRLVNLITSS